MNNPSHIRAWTFYDWANSAYSLIITSAIFPAYYSAIVPAQVNLFGHFFPRAALASYSISISFLLVALLTPLLSSLADKLGKKKAFMRFFCYLGGLACISMFFFTKGSNPAVYVTYGLFCSLLASIGYCGSLVFYNAFLPEIASTDQQDWVSAKGYSFGYIGSVCLMAFCFCVILLNDHLGWGLGDLPVRGSFVAVGLWWMGFAQITFRVLPEQENKLQRNTSSLLWSGYKSLMKVWHELIQNPLLTRFLPAFFFYTMGVQTVMYMAVFFASDVLKLDTPQLLGIILIIQLVAIPGAQVAARLSNRWGNTRVLMAMILIWITVCIMAWQVQTAKGFYLLAIVVGWVMGGIQSLSRSTYSKLLPDTTSHASYFSFYDVCEKIGIVAGTLSFGLIAEFAGGMRQAALWLAGYFLVGLWGLFRLWQRESALG